MHCSVYITLHGWTHYWTEWGMMGFVVYSIPVWQPHGPRSQEEGKGVSKKNAGFYFKNGDRPGSPRNRVSPHVSKPFKEKVEMKQWDSLRSDPSRATHAGNKIFKRDIFKKIKIKIKKDSQPNPGSQRKHYIVFYFVKKFDRLTIVMGKSQSTGHMNCLWLVLLDGQSCVTTKTVKCLH